jgi:hypothetical protein
MMATVVVLACAGLAAASCGGGSAVNEQDGSLRGRVIVVSPVAGPLVSAATTSVRLVRDGKPVDTERIPPRASFHFEVRPGAYVFEVVGIRGCATRAALVRPGEVKRTDIVCDPSPAAG